MSFSSTFYYYHANIVGILLIISIDTNFACSCHNFHYHYFHHYCLSLPLISSFSFNSFNVYWYSYCIWLLLNFWEFNISTRILYKHIENFIINIFTITDCIKSKSQKQSLSQRPVFDNCIVIEIIISSVIINIPLLLCS